MPFCYSYPRAAVTVDIILYTGFEILLIKRKNPPYQNHWALPGGFLDIDETLETAALRELAEETNIKLPSLSQFKTYDAIHRDPRHRTLSVVFFAIYTSSKDLARATDDAADIHWFPLENLPELAFDHSLILDDFRKFILERGSEI